MEDLKTKYSAVSAIYSETTDQNKPINIYIKKAKRDSNTPQEWIDNKTHEYLIVFHFTGCINPNYGHSYYIDTILESEGGLCLNSTPYESLDTEKMNCVRAFIEGFLISNKSKRFEIIDKKSHVITIDNMTSMYHSKPKN